MTRAWPTRSLRVSWDGNSRLGLQESESSDMNAAHA
jgi:hypothetical protein